VNRKIQVGVLVFSDRCARGDVEDRYGRRIVELLPADSCQLIECVVMPDELEAIRVALRDWASRCDVIITTGGTGRPAFSALSRSVGTIVSRT